MPCRVLYASAKKERMAAAQPTHTLSCRRAPAVCGGGMGSRAKARLVIATYSSPPIHPRLFIEVRKGAKLGDARFDLFARQGLDTLGAEALAGKRPERGAVEHGALPGGGGDATLLG